MKMKEIIKKNTADLQKELGEKQVALREFRFNFAGSKSKNVKQYASLKKEIARINTALKQKVTTAK